MSVIGSNILAGAAGQGGDYTIEESLRFNASQSSYLSWTPASAGNRKTWTWSGWVKRGNINTSDNQALFSASGGSAEDNIRFIGSGGGAEQNKIGFYIYNGGYIAGNFTTSQVFRDPSAWYHIVWVWDTTNATSTDRIRLYVNGERITAFDASSYPSLNADCGGINNSYQHEIGRQTNSTARLLDGYITEVNFIDGQALDASSFGEFDATTGVWKPKGYTGTYGTNGFYLPMQLDNTTEGFNTVTWVGNGSKQNIKGVGFSPDLVWVKNRNTAYDHGIQDSVRGATKDLNSNNTDAEETRTSSITAFLSDGFTLGGNDVIYNASGGSYVAWCWDAGNTTVSNTDGSITSSVRANPTYGFSVVSYTGTGANATVGHGLGVAPAMVIIKNRTSAVEWQVYHASIGNGQYGVLNSTAAFASSGIWQNTTPTSSAFSIGNFSGVNFSGNTYIAYCFSEVSGYSKFGSYSGNGSTSGPTITTGWKPAMVLIKRTDAAGSWYMYDNTRDAANPSYKWLSPNQSVAENTNSGTNVWEIDLLDNGFQIKNDGAFDNASGGSYIYMAFKDTREYAFWLDDSGNNNDWQPNGGITTSSTVTDTPTPYLGGGNYAVLNPLLPIPAGVSLSMGNLRYTNTGGGAAQWASTFTRLNTSISWFFEATCTTRGASDQYNYVGDGNGIYCTNGEIRIGGSVVTTVASYTSGDVIGVAFGGSFGLKFYKNGTQVYSGGASGGNGPIINGYNSCVWDLNFGQRPFAYTPPTGFLPLHTGNLPDSSIVDGSKYFDVALWTGDNTTNRNIPVGFEPDLVWTKGRNTASWNHFLQDRLRGYPNFLQSSSTGAETTTSPNIVSGVYADGFTIQNNGNSNNTGDTYVAWNWKANGTGVSNTDGSITSTVSANPTAGFSIVTYTGTGNAGDSFGHGLGVAPNLVIFKNRNSTNGWFVQGDSIGSGPAAGSFLTLQTTNAVSTSTNVNTTFGSSTVTLDVTAGYNGSGLTYVAYCFAEVEGYSKFGSYTGNGSADGVFVYTGFRPAFVLIKRTDSANWWAIFDVKRNTYNVLGDVLQANASDAEAFYTQLDVLSNGFKVRSTGASINASGGTYIYMAFAETDFAHALAR